MRSRFRRSKRWSIEHLAAGHIRLVIDLANVTYISSSGLRALLRARRQAQAGGGDVALCDMSARVTEVFDMIGFNNLFRIYPHATDAAVALTKMPIRVVASFRSGVSQPDRLFFTRGGGGRSLYSAVQSLQFNRCVTLFHNTI